MTTAGVGGGGELRVVSFTFRARGTDWRAVVVEAGPVSCGGGGGGGPGSALGAGGRHAGGRWTVERPAEARVGDDPQV